MTEEPEKEERRRYPRRPCDLLIEILDEPSEESRAFVRNMSLGGAFVETNCFYDLEDDMRFRVMFPTRKKMRSITAKIRWRRDTIPRGVGVEFVRARPSDLIAIETYLGMQDNETVIFERPDAKSMDGTTDIV